MNAVPVRVAMVTILAAANAIAQSTVPASLHPFGAKPATDVALRDAVGKTAKLNQFRGKVRLAPANPPAVLFVNLTGSALVSNFRVP